MAAIAVPTAAKAEPVSSRVAAHLAGVIERLPLHSVPFDHLVLEQPFPPDLYPSLLANLPADSYYRELKHSDALLPDGRSARLQFPLLAENIARLPALQRAFWTEVVGGLSAAAVQAAYKSRFSAVLERVRGRQLGAIRLRPYCVLFRDIGGYKISIHPDSPRKAITTQYYLPADESQTHLGTLFHVRRADGSFDAGLAMRFAPNSGYAFAVTPTSFHSVRPMGPDDRPRNSLMVIVSYDRGPLVEGVKAAQKKLRAWYDRLRGADPTEAGEGRYETM